MYGETLIFHNAALNSQPLSHSSTLDYKNGMDYVVTTNLGLKVTHVLWIWIQFFEYLIHYHIENIVQLAKWK